MKLRKILLAVAGLALMLNASAQKSKRYYVAKPGTLVELMTEAEANEITQLTLQTPHRTCGTQTGGRVGGKGKVCAAAKAKQHAEQDNNEL